MAFLACALQKRHLDVQFLSRARGKGEKMKKTAFAFSVIPLLVLLTFASNGNALPYTLDKDSITSKEDLLT